MKKTFPFFLRFIWRFLTFLDLTLGLNESALDAGEKSENCSARLAAAGADEASFSGGNWTGCLFSYVYCVEGLLSCRCSGV